MNSRIEVKIILEVEHEPCPKEDIQNIINQSIPAIKAKLREIEGLKLNSPNIPVEIKTIGFTEPRFRMGSHPIFNNTNQHKNGSTYVRKADRVPTKGS